jgi:hypothetical protein
MTGVIVSLLLISATFAGFFGASMIFVPVLGAAMLAFLLTDAPLAKELRPSGDVPAVASITVGLLVASLWIAAAYSLGRLISWLLRL